jgi:hypothetical protein
LSPPPSDSQMQREAGRAARSDSEPALEELLKALQDHVDRDGGVFPGISKRLATEHCWTGRLMDVLAVLTETRERIGYVSGGRRPDEVETWLAVWAASPLSVDEIRLIVESGGWDPDPFVVLAREGLLETILRAPDGSVRRVRGELVGGWVSDEFALAEDEEILRQARKILEGAL